MDKLEKMTRYLKILSLSMLLILLMNGCNNQKVDVKEINLVALPGDSVEHRIFYQYEKFSGTLIDRDLDGHINYEAEIEDGLFKGEKIAYNKDGSIQSKLNINQRSDGLKQYGTCEYFHTGTNVIAVRVVYHEMGNDFDLNCFNTEEKLLYAMNSNSNDEKVQCKLYNSNGEIIRHVEYQLNPLNDFDIDKSDKIEKILNYHNKEYSNNKLIKEFIISENRIEDYKEFNLNDKMIKHLTNKKLIGLDLTHFIVNTNIDFYVKWSKYGINNLKALDPRALFSLETADLLSYSDYGNDNSISTPTLANQLLAPKLPLSLEGIIDKKKLLIVIEKWDANGVISGYNLLGNTKRPITGIFSADYLPLNVNSVYSNYPFSMELNEPGNNRFDGIFRIEGSTTLDGYFKGNGSWECYKCGLSSNFSFKSKKSWETI